MTKICPQCERRKVQKNRKQCSKCLVYHREWGRKNREKANQFARIYTRRLRAKVLLKLGSKCANKWCRHLNPDGTLGCKDLRILHIDHKKGGGNKDRLTLWSQQIWKKALRYPRNF